MTLMRRALRVRIGDGDSLRCTRSCEPGRLRRTSGTIGKSKRRNSCGRRSQRAGSLSSLYGLRCTVILFRKLLQRHLISQPGTLASDSERRTNGIGSLVVSDRNYRGLSAGTAVLLFLRRQDAAARGTADKFAFDAEAGNIYPVEI